jgi:transcriptional regulator GlxA family with amidase domain
MSAFRSVSKRARVLGKRIERRFRRVLDRTVGEAIPRAHVELARTLLESTQAPLPEVAKRREIHSGWMQACLKARKGVSTSLPSSANAAGRSE